MPAERPVLASPSSPYFARRWLHLWVIAASGIYLYLSLFTLRGVPFLLSGDQVFYWMDSVRMMAGERIYRDFFKFTPPGTDMTYLGAFRLFGLHLWVPNLIVLVLGVLLCWLCFSVTGHFLSRSEALLAAAIVAVVLYGKLLNATHHWFSELAVLGAVAVLMRQRSGARIVLAGSLLGVATFITQTRGPAAAAGLTIYFLWNRYRGSSAWPLFFKRVLLLLGPLFLVWLALSAHFIAAIGWRQLWYWQVVYAAHFKVSGTSTLGLPPFADGHGLFDYGQALLVYLLLPVVYLLSLWSCFRQRTEPLDSRLEGRALLTFVGVTTALEVAQSPNWLRVYCVAAPAILLLIWAMAQAGKTKHCLAVALWVGVVCLGAHQIWARHWDQSAVVELPAGRVAAVKPAAEKLAWIGDRTRPGDFFFEPQWPGVYLPLLLRSPIYAEGLGATEETRPEFVAEAIQQLEAKQVRYILWSPRLIAAQAAEPNASRTDVLAPFQAFMDQRYARVWVFPDRDEIWERR
jgi:hypothetical protein